MDENKITKAETPPPSTCEPITHRRGWSKVREEAGEKVGVLSVLLEEGNKHGGENLSGCTRHSFFYFSRRFKLEE